MKAQDIWSGHEYAWYENKPKGKETPIGAIKVRVIRINRKKQHWGSERLSTFCDVELLQDKDYRRKAGSTIEVRARDIVDHWLDYSIREEEILSERRNKERIESEKKAKKLAEDNEIQRRFADKGLVVNIDYVGQVVIPRKFAIEWLGMKEPDNLEELLKTL